MSFLPPQIVNDGDCLTTGVKLAPGEKPGVRQELRTLKKDAQLWDLFLMGLWALQKVPAYRDLSFHKLAGIHGQPYVCWPPRDKTIQKQFVQARGFCTHSSIIFLPWHRPYLALYEQMIYEGILYVVGKMSATEGQAAAREKAKQFRLPYWDWAVTGLPVFPDEMLNETVDLPIPMAMRIEYSITDQSQRMLVHNPLYSYEFNPADAEPELLFPGSFTTERYAKRQSDVTKAEVKVSAEERKKRIYAAINPYADNQMNPFSKDINSTLKPEGNLRERVVYLVQSYQEFAEVSHNKFDPERQALKPEELPWPGATPEEFGKGFGSIEDIHNVVHGLVGGMGQDDTDKLLYDGHMANVEIAAFDPVFWIHHCNIDRVFALWQGLHDDPKNAKTYVTPQPAGGDNWARTPGATEDINTPLTPFYRTKTAFWTSEGVRDTANLGYVYPETQKWNFQSTVTYRSDILKRLDALYPNSSLANMMNQYWHGTQSGIDSDAALRERGRRLSKIMQAKGGSKALTAIEIQKDNSDRDNWQQGRNLKVLATDQNYDEFMFNIKAPKHAMDGKYQVHVFIGPIEEENTSLYTVAPTHIGTFSPLGQKSETACANCQTQMAQNQSVTGQIPLTIALVERYFAGIISDLEIPTVVKHLQEHLHWEVLDQNGNRLFKQRDKLVGLKVSVSSNEVTIPKTVDEIPTYSPMVKYHYAITTGLDGKGRGEGTGMTVQDLYGPQAWAKGEGVVIQATGDEEEGS